LFLRRLHENESVLSGWTGILGETRKDMMMQVKFRRGRSFALWTRCLLLVPALLVVAAEAFGAGDVVLIDTTAPAYTVYARLPGERAEAVRKMIAGQPGELVSFDEFAAAPDQYISRKILRDEHAGQRAVEGIVELLRKYGNTPFGITWNGGIAITRADYQFAKNRYELFNKDPDEYRRTMPRSDPTDPVSHLKPLLGW
jgi:hypothetical protein